MIDGDLSLKIFRILTYYVIGLIIMNKHEHVVQPVFLQCSDSVAARSESQMEAEAKTPLHLAFLSSQPV